MRLSVLYKLCGFYLATGLAGGMLNPYLTLIFVGGGLSKSDVGFVMAAASCFIIGAQIVWGRLADRYRMTKMILLLSLAVPAALSVFYHFLFSPVLIAAYMLSMVFIAPQAPISDAYAVSAARAAGSSYGTVRSFQSIGNAIGGYAGGLFLTFYLPNDLWIPFLLFSCMGIAVVLSLPKQTEVRFTGKSFLSGMGELVRNKRFVLFLGACFLVNQTLTAFNTYFVVVFEMSGGTYALSGVALLIAALSNVPAMFAAAPSIRKIGPEKTMLLGSAAYMIRWTVQYIYPVPPVMVAVQVLQGLSFGLFYIAAVEYVARLVRIDMQATGQSIFNMVFVGLAGIAGNLLNGYLLEIGGPSFMNLACAISSLIGGCLLFAVAYRNPYRKAAAG